MKKAPEAFRTISEVSDLLETPAHVLRFWESKFYQIRPVKRAGGRRYYRPDDVALINGIRLLLQDQGMTIRGVQRILQEEGVKHVVALGSPLPVRDDGPDDGRVIEADADAGAAPSQDAAMDAASGVTESQAADATEPAAADDTPALPVAAQVRERESVPLPAGASVTENGPSDAIVPAIAAERVARIVIEDGIGIEGGMGAEGGTEAGPRDGAELQRDGTTPVAPVHGQDDTTAPAEQTAFEPPRADAPATESTAQDLAAGENAAVARDAAGPATGLGAAAARISDDEPPEERDPAVPSAERIAQMLRKADRGQMGPRRDKLTALARRIDTLLERMSEASGAGRW